MILVLIAAVAENGVIGRGGEMPWRLKSDLQHFRRATMGKPVVMGRRTYQSLFKPLAGRTAIVVTRDADFAAPGVIVAHSLEAALAAAHGDALRRGTDTIMVAGGGDIYGQTIAAADRILITRVHERPDGDVTFPPIDPAHWRETGRTEHVPGAGDSAAFAFIIRAGWRRHQRRAPDRPQSFSMMPKKAAPAPAAGVESGFRKRSCSTKSLERAGERAEVIEH